MKKMMDHFCNGQNIHVSTMILNSHFVFICLTSSGNPAWQQACIADMTKYALCRM